MFKCVRKIFFILLCLILVPFNLQADITSKIVAKVKIKTGIKVPEIKINNVDGKTISLEADTSKSGLADGTALKWEVEGTSITSKGTVTSIELLDYASDYTIKLSVVPPQGATLVTTKSVKTGYGVPKITMQQIEGSGLDYEFNLDLEGTGITESDISDKKWYVNDTPISGPEYVFAKENETYNIRLEVKVGDQIITAKKTITTETADQPSLTATQVGDNPLQWKVEANIGDTVIGDNWDFKWYVNGEPKGSSETSFEYDFDAPATTYNVEFKATNGSLERQASFSLKTGYGTPTITSNQIGGSGLDYQFDVDTTGTGIPSSGVDYKWYVNGDVVSNSKAFEYVFAEEGATYTVKAEATVDGKTVKVEKTINTGAAEQPSLTALQENDDPLSWKVEADFTNTIIDADWTKEWYIDNQSQPETSGTLNHTFSDFGSDHNIKFVAKSPDGSITRQSEVDFTTGYGTPSVTSSQVGGSGLDYQFDVDTTGTGIPSSGVDYKWYVNGNKVSDSKSFEYVFDGEGETYTVKAEVTANGKTVVTEKTITTDVADQPTLSSSQVGSDPLDYEINADISSTIIGADWTKEWYVNDELISSGDTSFTYTFPISGTTYNVKFKAKNSDGIERFATTQVTVASATPPTIEDDGTAIEGDLKYQLQADIKNTGITDAWSFEWSSSPSASFSSSDLTTVATFPNYSTSYTVTLTATPPVSSKQAPVTQTTNIQIGEKPPMYPDRAVYVVESHIGVNASQIANYYNSIEKPDGVASIASSGENLIFTCKADHYLSQAAVDVSRHDMTDQNKSEQGKSPSDYYTVGYSSDKGISGGGGGFKTFGNEAYNQRPSPVIGPSPTYYSWGVNCFKL